MGSGQRSNLKNLGSSVVPGPGIYDVTKGVDFIKGKTSPKITMGPRINDHYINGPEKLPGPGQYEVNKSLDTSKSFTMGKKFDLSQS